MKRGMEFVNNAKRRMQIEKCKMKERIYQSILKFALCNMQLAFSP